MIKYTTGIIRLFLLVSCCCGARQVVAFLLPAKDSTLGRPSTSFVRIPPTTSRFTLRSTIVDNDDDDDESIRNNNDPAILVDVEYQNDPYTTTMKRSTMVKIAQELRNKYGYLLNPLVVPRQKQTELFDAILELEDDFLNSKTSSMTPTTTRDDIVAMLPGDWDLIATIPLLPTSLVTPNNKAQQQQPPALLDNEFLQNLFPSTLPLAALTNQFVTITQRIRTNDAAAAMTIDRVDHVITVQPPNQVGDLFASFLNNNNNNNNENNNREATTSSWWNNLNINPLDVTESKVILIHTAQVVTDADHPVKLRLKLQSVVNNLAGTGASFLDPQGSNLLSVNVPQLDFLTNEWNDALGGSFVTTYVDDEYRISRSDLLPSSSALGGSDNKKKAQQIRIFRKRQRPVVEEEEKEDMEVADVDDIAIEAPSDVED